MDQVMEKCQNCFQLLPQSKMPTHFGYCRRYIRKCQKCQQMYDANFKQEHQDEFHQISVCTYCQLDFLSSELAQHQPKCLKKPKLCQYCELQVPLTQFQAHLTACQSRTQSCQKCLKLIANKHFFIHLASCTGPKEKPKIFKNYENVIEEKRTEQKVQEKKVQEDLSQSSERRYSQNQQRRPERWREIKYQPVPKREQTNLQNRNHYKLGSLDNRIDLNYRQRVHEKPTYIKNVIENRGEKENQQQETLGKEKKYPTARFERKLQKQQENMQNDDPFDEDEELQRIIMMSMGEELEKRKRR